MLREPHYMIDIETTGVDQRKDSILEIALVEISFNDGYWHTTGRKFHKILNYTGHPESEFAKKHMKGLYKKCNETPWIDKAVIAEELQEFVHNNAKTTNEVKPRFFMGWNASNFDMPFMFSHGLLTPSYYAINQETKKEELRGDAHYRIYEQTGSVQILSDMTGLDRKTIEALAMDLNPTGLSLPEGKSHDALYDCYKQIIMQNGLIKIGRMGIRK